MLPSLSSQIFHPRWQCAFLCKLSWQKKFNSSLLKESQSFLEPHIPACWFWLVCTTWYRSQRTVFLLLTSHCLLRYLVMNCSSGLFSWICVFCCHLWKCPHLLVDFENNQLTCSVTHHMFPFISPPVVCLFNVCAIGWESCTNSIKTIKICTCTSYVFFWILLCQCTELLINTINKNASSLMIKMFPNSLGSSVPQYAFMLALLLHTFADTIVGAYMSRISLKNPQF